MRRISFRLRSVLVASFFAGLAGIACTEGVGGRCVQDSDCSSGMCSATGETTEGGRCVAPGSTVTLPGTGGTPVSGAAGTGGAGGAAGGGGLGGAAGAAGAAGSLGVGGTAGASATGGNGGNGGIGGSTAGVAGTSGHDGGTADASADH